MYETRNIKGLHNYVISEVGVVTNTETGRSLKNFYTETSIGPILNIRACDKQHLINICRLLYKLFVGDIKHTEVIVFKDGDNHNTHWSNLDKRRRKTPFVVGHLISARLPDETIRYIRSSNDSLVTLSKELGIHVTTVGSIKRFNTYKNVI